MKRLLLSTWRLRLTTPLFITFVKIFNESRWCKKRFFCHWKTPAFSTLYTWNRRQYEIIIHITMRQLNRVCINIAKRTGEADGSIIFARNVLGHDNMPPLFMYLFFCYYYEHVLWCFFFTFPILCAWGFTRSIQLLLLFLFFLSYIRYNMFSSPPEFRSPRPWLARKDGKNNVFLRLSNYYSRGEMNKKIKKQVSAASSYFKIIHKQHVYLWIYIYTYNGYYHWSSFVLPERKQSKRSSYN